MSATTIYGFDISSPKKEGWCKCIRRFFHRFSLDGHFNYAFVYGSWEVIKARKVGTTHTPLDYVVYRLFYPVILFGSCIFGLVQDTNLSRYFSYLEMWVATLHMAYAFIFLQNVLQNNIYRDDVQHRQTIPERLIVTDEIERGGHKFYICRRYSILPTGSLSGTEKAIYFMFNIVIPLNVTHMLAFVMNKNYAIPEEGKHPDEFEKVRKMCNGGLALAEVFLTPIPMRFAHIIFPMIYTTIYLFYSKRMYDYDEKQYFLYLHLDWDDLDDEERAGQLKGFIVGRYVGMMTVFSLIFCLSKIRDYVISLMDDSRTPRQLQNLRAQKRLARRKIMNYIEGPDGRIVQISLEKHSYAQTMDEVIQTDKDRRLTSNKPMNTDTSSSSSEEDDETAEENNNQKSKSADENQDFVPLGTKPKPSASNLGSKGSPHMTH